MLKRLLIKKFSITSRRHYCASIAATLNSTFNEIQPKQQTTLISSDFRTGETNTSSHSEMHEAKFYTIAPDIKKQLFGGGGFPKEFEKQVKTFTETCLMIRQPALEIIDYIKRSDLNRPAIRYVLYGENGVGKTLLLAHIIHYGYQNDFILIHIPWVPNWMKRPKEITNLEDGIIDLPFDAAAWLIHFKSQNSKLLTQLNLKTTKEYVWSKREATASGSTLSELVEHGIARIKYASETIKALIEQLKQHASEGHCKIMVAIDGYNAFFHPFTRILGENKQPIPPERLTLTEPFLSITNYDWTNGFCLLTVDKIGMTEGFMESYMPYYLLGRKGFEHLDPFIPIHITDYTDKEFHSCIQYYVDRMWISKAPEGYEEQLKYMSNKNPYNLMRLTRSL